MDTRVALAAIVLMTAACSLSAQNQVRVADSRELARAVASNRTVLLAPGQYLVTEVAQVGNPAVSWNKTFDGPELVITGVSNLTLRAERSATLLAAPRYAFTLVFVDCRNLILEGLTLGHTEAGECGGGVLRFDACAGVRIQGCELFGSGVVGIDVADSSGITIRASTIRDCTAGALWANNVQGLRLEKVLITSNKSYPLISISSSRGVVLESCRIERNSGDALFQVDGGSDEVALPGSEITGNRTYSLVYDGSLLPDLSQTRVADNSFDNGAEEDDGEYDEGYGDE